MMFRVIVAAGGRHGIGSAGPPKSQSIW